jgi:excisionase family DNA binding protein
MKWNPEPTERPRARRLHDACQTIGISRSHLYALEKAGKIRLVRIGGRVVVPETEIDRLLSEGAA